MAELSVSKALVDLAYRPAKAALLVFLIATRLASVGLLAKLGLLPRLFKMAAVPDFIT